MGSQICSVGKWGYSKHQDLHLQTTWPSCLPFSPNSCTVQALKVKWEGHQAQCAARNQVSEAAGPHRPG